MNRKQNNKKRDITLMTILAYESTNDAQKLLKKYNKPGGKDYADLEVKLADLYFNVPDKVQLEKEMASIHPHKNWILENVEPIVKIEKKEIEVEAKVDEKTAKEIEELKKLLQEKEESKKFDDIKNEMKKALQEEFDRKNSSSQNTMGGNPFYSQVPIIAQPTSSFSGDVDRTKSEPKDNAMAIVGLVSITAITGLLMLSIFRKFDSK
jgi:hypothetical protein